LGCADSGDNNEQHPSSNRPMANRISKPELEQMFAQIEQNTDWNMNGNMVWGYFFTDSDPQALERAAKVLES
jgi:hypothetical protein